MEQIEKIEVYLKTNKKGKTICMCLVDNPACLQPECEKDFVFRDLYFEWQKTMNGRY